MPASSTYPNISCPCHPSLFLYTYSISLNSQMEEQRGRDGCKSEACIVEERDGQTGALVCRFIKGRLLGKGGFAKCYQFTEVDTNRKWAAKVVDKTTLGRGKAREKVGNPLMQLTSQIRIHRSVKSQFVVRYERYFEDTNYVYILLQLCPNQTLNELVRRRKRLTEIQTRYYMRQIALAVRDLHQQLIIHRDLKLGNLLLTHDLQIRLSDFGLAARLSVPSERRKTMCGTPNYIAPQILQSSDGHSFQVDMWSMGVIAYAFLVGRPPFQTTDVKATYAKIKTCNYSFPDMLGISASAKHFISKMLQKHPRHRATIDEILADQFLTKTPLPPMLPISTLASPPNATFLRQFLCQDNNNDTPHTLIRTNSIENLAKKGQVLRAASTAALSRPRPPSKLQKGQLFPWILYFEQNPKFGVAYLLNSGAAGMRYNDSTCLIGNCAWTTAKYVGVREEVFEVAAAPDTLAKKIKILVHYQKQLRKRKEEEEASMVNEALIQRERLKFRETPDNALATLVTRHCKTSKANIFWFNSGHLQASFRDNTQLHIANTTVVYVNKAGERKIFPKTQLDLEPQEVKKRMKYIHSIVDSMKENKKERGESKENRENNQENNRDQGKENMGRSSSTFRLEKRPLILRGCASTTRLITNPLKSLKY